MATAHQTGAAQTEAAWADLLGQMLERQERMADQQARDAWLLEALTEKIDQIAGVSAAAEAGGVVEALPAALAALTTRLESVANAVGGLVRAVETDRETQHDDLVTFAKGVEARAADRESRIVEDLGEKITRRVEAFAGRPAELVAQVTCKSVEDLGAEVARLGLELKEALANAERGQHGGHGEGAAALLERLDAMDAAAQSRAGGLSARLEAALGAQSATVAEATARLDTLFDRLDRIDARTEGLAAEAGALDAVERLAEQQRADIARLSAELAALKAATEIQQPAQIDADALAEAVMAKLQGAFVDAAAERLRGMVDARVAAEAPALAEAAARQIVNDAAPKLAEQAAAAAAEAASALREDVADAVCAEVGAALDAKLVREVASAEAKIERSVDARLASDVAERVAEAAEGLETRLRGDTRASFSAIEASLKQQASELAQLADALNAIKPLESSAKRMDAFFARLSALPTELGGADQPPAQR